MSSHSSSTPYGLYRHLVLLLLFPSLILCISDATLQNRGLSSDASPLFLRSVPNANDAVDFDSMPSCAREKCLPYRTESIGCPSGDLSRGCFCDAPKSLDCAFFSCTNTEFTLAAKWRTLTCTGFGFDQLSAVPACAQPCLLSDSVFQSCSLKSFDCFCAGDLPSSCLATCSSADAQTAKTWRSTQCTKAQPNVKAEGVAKTSTIPAKVSTYTDPSGSLVTSTIAPAVTTVIMANANTNGNTNTINVSTGEAQGLLSGLAM